MAYRQRSVKERIQKDPSGPLTGCDRESIPDRIGRDAYEHGGGDSDFDSVWIRYGPHAPDDLVSTRRQRTRLSCGRTRSGPDGQDDSRKKGGPGKDEQRTAAPVVVVVLCRSVGLFLFWPGQGSREDPASDRSGPVGGIGCQHEGGSGRAGKRPGKQATSKRHPILNIFFLRQEVDMLKPGKEKYGRGLVRDLLSIVSIDLAW